MAHHMPSVRQTTCMLPSRKPYLKLLHLSGLCSKMGLLDPLLKILQMIQCIGLSGINAIYLECCHRITLSSGCRYIFPGLAFGAHLAKSGIVTDEMLTAAAEALPKLLSDSDVKAGRVYPDLNNIRLAGLDMLRPNDVTPTRLCYRNSSISLFSLVHSPNVKAFTRN